MCVCVCVCVCVFTRYHAYLCTCLRSTSVNARVGRSLCACRRVYVGVYICDCLPACVRVNVCVAASVQSIAVLRLLSLCSSPHINASISTPYIPLMSQIAANLHPAALSLLTHTACFLLLCNTVTHFHYVNI